MNKALTLACFVLPLGFITTVISSVLLVGKSIPWQMWLGVVGVEVLSLSAGFIVGYTKTTNGCKNRDEQVESKK